VLVDRPHRDPDLAVTIIGDPKTKGSTTSFVPHDRSGQPARRPNGSLVVVTKNDAGPDADVWAAAISTAAHRQMAINCLDYIRQGGVWVELTFVRPRTKGHYGTGRNAGVLKDSAPAYPAVRPDIDKLERCALDALTGVVYGDDGQVVALRSVKVFGEPARLELAVWQLPPTVADQHASDQAVLIEGGCY
jgi:Holliday junction resolvase RusA-like endonuclease